MKQQLRIILLILAMIAGGASSELHAIDGVSYLDNDGTVKKMNGVTVLYSLNDFGNLAPGWYVVTRNIECNGIRIEVSALTGYENGDVHIIIQNGVTMDITDNGINITNDYGNVYFHAESNTGTPGKIFLNEIVGGQAIYANCDITFNGLNVEAECTMDFDGICSNGNITVNGGSITAIGESHGIICNGFFTMNGCTVDARGIFYGICAFGGVVFNGGNLTANGTEDGGIYGNVTLKWTSPDDSFTANGISDLFTVTIPVGYAFTDGTVIYQSGSYSSANFPNGLTLTPNLPASVTSLDTDGNVVKKKYLTFDDAFNAAKTAYVPGNGSDVAEFIPTITLHDDIDTGEDEYSIGNGSDAMKVKIDLNGHDLSGNGEGCLFTVNNNAVLTVVDNSDEDVEKGTVSYNNETAQAAIKVEIGGTLKTKSVSFACVLGDAIYNAGTAEIDGGTLTGLTGIYCKGSTTVTRTTISGSYYGIYAVGDDLTIGSGVSIVNYHNNAIYCDGGKLTFNAIPAITKEEGETEPDVIIEGETEIAYGAGSFTAPLTPMTLRVKGSGDADVNPTFGPVTIATGYADNVIEDGSVIDPNRVFSWYDGDKGYKFAVDADGKMVMGKGKVSVASRNGDGLAVTSFFVTFDDAFSVAYGAYHPNNVYNEQEVVPTITLLDNIDDVDENYHIGEGDNTVKMKIDLNGHNLNGNIAGSYFTVYATSVLEFVDSSTDPAKKGTVKNDGEEAIATIEVASNGTLKATGVSIDCYNANAISNNGTAEIDGCNISGYYGILSYGTTTVTRTAISGEDFGICVNAGSTTIGSGVSISGYQNDGISYVFGSLTFTAIPTLTKAENATCPDIIVENNKVMTFAEGSFTAPQTPMTIRVRGSGKTDVDATDEPVTIANGYEDYVNEGNGVIAPSRLFRWYQDSDDYGFGVNEDDNVIMGAASASVSASYVGGGELTAKCYFIDEAFSAARQVYAAANDAILQAMQEDPTSNLEIDDYIPTVKLLADIDHSEGTITLASPGESVFVTLDLNGHTLSGDDNELIYVTGLYRLIIDDSAGDGRIVNTGTSAIYNNAYVLVKGGTFAGSTYCIDNNGSLDVSGGTFVMGEYANGILNQRWLTFTGLPRFVHSSDRCFTDIRLLQDTYITFGAGTYVVPERPITVLIYNDEPYTFTSNYGTYVKSGENVIDPADIFIPFNMLEGLRVCMDVQSAEALIEGASAAAVTLYDDANNSSSIVRNQFANVTLSGRTLAWDGTWNTLCLPFDVYDFEAMDYNDNYLFFPLVNATVKELDIDGTYDENGAPAVDGPYKTGLDTQTGELRLYFREVRRIEAGKPYIVKWDAGEGAYFTDPEFRNVILKDDIKPVAFPGGTFVGQFSPFEIVNDAVDFSTTQGNINEILFLSTATDADNSLKTVLGYSANPRTLRSCRAHFYVPAGQGVSAVRSINLNFGDDGEATGIVAQPTLNSQFSVLNSGAWYSVDGRKLSGEPKAKGVYIHNSKKIIIK